MGIRMSERRGVARCRRNMWRCRTAGLAACGAVACGSVLAVPSAFAVTPGEMKPKYNEFPFMDTLANKIQGFMGVALLVMVGVIAVAAIAWAVAKAMNSQGGQKVTGIVFLIVFGACALIGSAGAGVLWFSGLSLF